MNPVVHFEMPAEDKERMCKFYEQAFGWKFVKYGPELGNYIVAHTCEMDDKNMPKEKGMINGGFYEKTNEAPHPSIVIATDDIKSTMEKIRKAGGKILYDPPMDMPGVGLFSSIIDTEGNRVGLIQPKNM